MHRDSHATVSVHQDRADAIGLSVWSRNTRRVKDGSLSVGGVSVRELATRFGTPCFVLDEADFRSRCRDFRSAFRDGMVYYAGKAFLSRAVAAIAHQEGLGIDVCSAGELAIALAAGVPPMSVALHGNSKPAQELDRAVAAGVGRIIIDSGDEIGQLTAVARRRAVRPRVLIRVTPGIEAHTHDYVATAHDDQKFGFSLASGAAAAAIDAVLAEDVLELRGLHCHVGSQIFDTAAFELAAERLLRLQARTYGSGGRWLPELNLGGGFGIAYTAEDDPKAVPDLANDLRKIITQECATLQMPVPTLVVEPGRAIVGPAMLTLYRVGTVKPLPGLRSYVSVDGGMSDNIRTALYGATYTTTLAGRTSVAPPVLTRVVGKHCESGDIVVRDAYLPGDLRAGDLLAVAATGAYCRSMASNYNHTLRPPVIAVTGGQARAIVRRETEADLFALDLGPVGLAAGIIVS